MKKEVRLFVGRDGTLTVEDPSPLEVKLLGSLGIKLEENKPSACKLSPSYRFFKRHRIQAALPQNYGKLLDLHNQEIKRGLSGKTCSSGNYSIFDLKRKIFEKALKKCYLCGHRCGGRKIISGDCPMGTESYYHQHFIHTGEEQEIGRTLVIELAGCNISCKFCQKGELIKPERGRVKPLTPSLWEEIGKEYQPGEFDTISFLGGNPDQSFLAILDLLENAPEWASHFPIVWHTNGYSSPVFYDLLQGLVDILVFDFKYFSDYCAVSLSNAPGYPDTAREALDSICSLNSTGLIIVRHLVLPGHWNCCQKPLIEFLGRLRDKIIFHPMAQYKPSWKITGRDRMLSSPLKESEFTRVKTYALDLGLKLTSAESAGISLTTACAEARLPDGSLELNALGCFRDKHIKRPPYVISVNLEGEKT